MNKIEICKKEFSIKNSGNECCIQTLIDALINLKKQIYIVKLILKSENIIDFNIITSSEVNNDLLILSVFLIFERSSNYEIEGKDFETSSDLVLSVIKTALADAEESCAKFLRTNIEKAAEQKAIQAAFADIPGFVHKISRMSFCPKIEVFGTELALPQLDKSLITNRQLHTKAPLSGVGIAKFFQFTDFHVVIDIDSNDGVKRSNLVCKVDIDMTVSLLKACHENHSVRGNYEVKVIDNEYYLVKFELIQSCLQL